MLMGRESKGICLIDQVMQLLGNIPCDKKIVIYGLGRLGQSLIQQMVMLNCHQIVAVCDRNAEVAYYEGIPVRYVKEIVDSCTYDYVVIAVANYYIANEIYYELVENGIRPSSIIHQSSLVRSFPIEADQWKSIISDVNRRKADTEHLYVAVRMRGGIGDHVVFLSFCRRLLSFSHYIVIDVFLDKSNAAFIFEGIDRIQNIVCENEIYDAVYDLVFDISRLIHVRKKNDEKICTVSKKLMETIIEHMNTKIIQAFDDEAEKNIEVLGCAKLLKYNRYQMLGNGNIWNLKEDMSKLDLNKDYEGEYLKLSSGRYITINCGADSSVCEKDRKQTKIWPFKYYEKLCSLIHDEYSDIKIIQLGDGQSEQINGCNQAFMDKDFRLVEYVLKNSMLHIDCEGGLVHMATQLGTKCLVMFGPTPVWFYGYDKNINLVGDACRECMGIVKNWYTECILGPDEPVCMKSITPELVMKSVKEYIDMTYTI